ncbi:MAG: 50S ribosomal protein L24 [candidate division Zixibacteria bacterium]|nr:50S ribosomal protein L24 [candidate division Zixibacteria bacterium]
MHIRKGDTVYIRTGSHKGKTGKVLFVDTKANKVVVEGINMKKRHQRPTQKSPKGGIISIEAPVHMSNVALYSSSLSGPIKTSMRAIEEAGKKKKVRICRRTGEQV